MGRPVSAALPGLGAGGEGSTKGQRPPPARPCGRSRPKALARSPTPRFLPGAPRAAAPVPRVSESVSGESRAAPRRTACDALSPRLARPPSPLAFTATVIGTSLPGTGGLGRGAWCGAGTPRCSRGTPTAAPSPSPVLGRRMQWGPACSMSPRLLPVSRWPLLCVPYCRTAVQLDLGDPQRWPLSAQGDGDAAVTAQSPGSAISTGSPGPSKVLSDQVSRQTKREVKGRVT
uniref:Uncharacterized protein n=1 Tax=Rousettus aegyptiacus TaxID=9407 RepID=A0A7J8D6K8_ROUAE|nr:hypothetical protein HJG63_008823 [Rousettus aegyptiacus]